MTETAAAPSPAPGLVPAEERIAYDREVRFGVVMYGGVSLAIYINGVANELFELACATPKVEGPPPDPLSTRAVYQRLSLLLRNPALRKRYTAYLADQKLAEPKKLENPFDKLDPATGAERVRFVIDVIAGTSAGGINGVFLAKALANGQAFSALKTLWVQEGDIDLLLNDERSYTDIAFAKTNAAPQSLLNSDRMYLKLLDAMETMEKLDPVVAPIGAGESALSDEIDLYVTTTDILGAVVPLRLFDKVVHEKRHKQVYHFKYAAGGRQELSNDFSAVNTSFLAFAARCTSSFPFAFEPMQVTDATRVLGKRIGSDAPDMPHWKSFFTGLAPKDMAGDGWKTRAFGDGGYLDNKPFSYVAEALSWRLGTVAIERKLLYIEPAPAHPELAQQPTERKPNAIQNAIAALTGIPQYESIREDLQAVLERNRRIERVERIVRKVEADAEMVGEEPFARVLFEKNNVVPKWEELDLGKMIGYYGVAFLPYWRLRLSAVTDDLADRLADHWRIDRHSDRLYAMRSLVRAWREQHYYEHEFAKTRTATQTRPINAFINDFDIKYRVRRAAFLLRKTHQLVRVVTQMALPEADREPASNAEVALQARLVGRVPGVAQELGGVLAALKQLRKGLATAFSDLRAVAWPGSAALGGTVSDADSDLLGRLLGLLIGEKLREPLLWLPGTQPGQQVRIALHRMPLPSPLRTLQENVFDRTQALFTLAASGEQTQLQKDLEADIGSLHAAFTTFITVASHAGKLRVRDLLGNPQLDVVAKPTDDLPDRKAVAVRIFDVALPEHEAALNTPGGRLVRTFLAEYYLRFDEYDQMSFPLYYDTGTGEPSTVEVVRVSPEDAPSLIDQKPGNPRKKLAGTELFNFGGFLDAQWRRNDIMWGRLDGCERLLATLLPEADALRNALLGQAQRAILREEMKPEAYDQLVRSFADLLKTQQQATVGEAFEALWSQLGHDDSERHKRLAIALKSLFDDEGLIAYVKEHYEVRRELDPEKSLKTAARAITITGRILEGIEKEQRRGAERMVWVTRAGRAFQALLAISTPGSLREKLRGHWLIIVYTFEALVFLGAFVFGSVDARNFALTAFALTLAVHAASLITGDYLHRVRDDKQTGLLDRLATCLAGDVSEPRYRWARRLGITAAALAVGLTILGGIGFWFAGPTLMFCGKEPPDTARAGLRAWVCDPRPAANPPP